MFKHTPLFTRMTKEISDPKHLYQIDPQKLKKWLSEPDAPPYQRCIDLLREVNDAQCGIVSFYNEEKKYWVRDSTNAKPLQNRDIDYEAPIFEANNALLRSLSRLRGIDFALNKKAKTDSANKEVYQEQQGILREAIANLSESLLTIANDSGTKSSKKTVREIKKQEKRFNTLLVSALYHANLTKGCSTEKDAEKLLARYRKLSALLTPTRPVAVLFYDEARKMFVREIHIPVTTKIEAQKKAMQEELDSIFLYPDAKDRTVHRCAAYAFQEADVLFSEKLTADDTLLPPIARTDYVAGLKNAFLVKVETLFDVENDDTLKGHALEEDIHALPENRLWIARASTPVYHGEFEDTSKILKHTQHNIEQLKAFINTKIPVEDTEKRLHICSLNTEVGYKHEDRVIQFLRKAQHKDDEKQYTLSYLPYNALGTLHRLQIDADLLTPDANLSQGRAPFNKAARVHQIVNVLSRIYQNNAQANDIALVQCFGGVDRTMTTIYAFLQKWLAERNGASVNNQEEHEAVISRMSEMLARGGNPAAMADFLCPGSSGMLTDVQAGNFFDKQINKEYYRPTSKARKKNKVDTCSFLRTPCPLQRKEYKNHLENLKRLLEGLSQDSLLKQVGNVLVLKVKAIAGKDGGPISSVQLSDINVLLRVAKEVIENPGNSRSRDQLDTLAKHLYRESTATIWQGLAKVCLALSFIALMVVGVMSFIPTFGMSIALTGIGCLGLATLAAKQTYSGKRGHNYFEGSFFSYKERELAKQCNLLFVNTAPAAASASGSVDNYPTDEVVPDL